MTKIDLSIFDFDQDTTLEMCKDKLILGLGAIFRSLEREAILQNEVAHLKLQLFGKSSEKMPKPKEPDPMVFDEAKASEEELKNDDQFVVLNAEDDIDLKDEDPLSENLDLVVKTSSSSMDADASLKKNNKDEGKNKKRGRKPIPKVYPRKEIFHELSLEETVCPCGCQMTKFGEEVTEQIEIIPAEIVVLRHRRFKYSCKTCQEGVKIAPLLEQAISKSSAAPNLLSHVAVLKFDDHLPLYRQSEILNRLGIDIPRSTLSSWVLKMGEALKPLTLHLQNYMVEGDYIKADETPTQVLKTPGKKDTSNSYMWVYMTGNFDYRHPYYQTKPAVIYECTESRGGENAKTFLTGFKGVLQTDGYSGYLLVTNPKKDEEDKKKEKNKNKNIETPVDDNLNLKEEKKDVIAMGCWAHARRKFFEVWNVSKREGIASKALEIIGELYEIERAIKEESFDKKREVRQEKSKKILEAFHQWLLEIKPKVSPKGSLDRAVQYSLNQWKSLSYYVEDGKIDMDNNAAERQIRPFTVGRKNWLFMGSPRGAEAASVLYSLIETAKLNGLNPEEYLSFVLKHKIDPMNKKLLESLMPWNVPLLKKDEKAKDEDDNPLTHETP